MKQAPGEGNVRQLPSGRWRVRVTTADKRRIGGVFDTREEAEGVRRALVAKLAAAGEAPTGSMTLGAWGLCWLEERGREGVAGVRSERSAWDNRIRPHALGALPLSAVTRGAIKAWLTDQRKSTVMRKSKRGKVQDTGKTLSHGSLGRLRTILSGALAAANERGLIPTNPAAGIEIRANARGERPAPTWTFLSPEEIRRVLECDAIPTRFRLLYQVAIYTGMRRGELWALEWGDLTLEGQRPEVHVQRSNDGATKTGSSRRVPLLPPALAALLRLRALAKDTTPSALVFPTHQGKRRNRNDRGMWGANGSHPGYCKAAGIERRVPFHALRHTCASALVMGYWGPPWRLEDVRKFLGHTSVSMTERYAHLSPEYLHERAKDTARPAVSLCPPDRVLDPPVAKDTTRRARETRTNPAMSAPEPGAQVAAEPVGIDQESMRRVLGVSSDLARALLRGVAARVSTEAIVAALVESVRGLGAHPLTVQAAAVDEAGPLRTARALALADAVLAFEERLAAEQAPSPALGQRPPKTRGGAS